MKNIWKIFTNDVKNISTNWVATIIISGLIFLPSLYAWLNILASWDPYAQTDQMAVAIVNEDKGAAVRNEEVNAGAELVKTLKTNNNMDWKFTDRQTAMKKVDVGDYFAVIIIPENFSTKLATVISNQPEKATVEYYVNEKINSIAPKITEKGASVIVDQMSSHFIATINEIIFDIFNRIGLEIEKDLPDIQQFEQYIFTLEKSLPSIHQLLTNSLEDVNSAESVVQQIEKLLPETKKHTSNGLTTIQHSLELLQNAEVRMNEVSPKLEQDMKKIHTIIKDSNEFLTNVQSSQINFNELHVTQKQLKQNIVDASKAVNNIATNLHLLNKLNDSQQTGAESSLSPQDKAHLVHAIQQTETLKAILQESQANTEDLQILINNKQGEVNSILNSLQQTTANMNVKLDEFLHLYTKEIKPTITQEIHQGKQTLLGAKNILITIESLLPEAERLLSDTSLKFNEGETILKKILNEYPYIYSKVTDLANKIRQFQSETDLNEVIQLLVNDPSAGRSFFEEPITLKENKLYPIENYGTGMTPFYTVLSIWVGCLLLISLLSVEASKQSLYSVRTNYYGKMLTFWTIGLLQTMIVTIGDIVVIGVEVKEPVWFVIFGIFISLVFMTIVYTLVSVFGDVGKAMAIVMLVLQIAGSGGTYPVALLPSFFQWLNPVLPFTYAIDLMREAVGGIVWKNASIDLLVLFILAVLFLLFGTFLKEKTSEVTRKLLTKSRESGLFH